MLKEELVEVNKTVERCRSQLNAQLNTIHRLKEKNVSLILSNADFIKAKIGNQISQRSHIMVDLSIFSDFFHSSDHLLEEQQAIILDSKAFASLKKVALGSGCFAVTQKACFPDGDCVVLKRYKFYRDEQTKIKNLGFISHEHRLLKLVGSHQNLVSSIGIVSLSGLFYSVLSYEGNTSLDSLIKNDRPIDALDDLITLITGIANGVNHLHDKGVLHNHIVPGNIMIRNDIFPILIGFSFACRAICVKNECSEVLKRFTDHRHIAPELFKSARVHYTTDVYAFGYTIKSLMKRTCPASDTLIGIIETFSQKCMEKKVGNRPPHKFLFNKTNQLFRGCHNG